MSATTPLIAPRRRVVALIAGACLLMLAVVRAPFPLASAWPSGGYPDVTSLSDEMSSGFVAFWHEGTGSLGPGLAGAVDYWARFHVIKAVLVGALLIVLLPLGSRIWAAYARTQRLGRRLLLGLSGLFHAGIALLALLVLVANIQGALAPLSSALGLMPLGDPDPPLAATVRQVRRGLATGQETAALDTLVHDFAVYHAAMAGIGAVVTLALVASSILLWRRRAGVPHSQHRQRRVLVVGVGALLVVAFLFAVVTAANVSTLAHPAPALLGFFDGGL